MNVAANAVARRDPALENATRVAVVAALSATTMLFASLASALLVRASFTDWRPLPAIWPVILLAFASLASGCIEIASRAETRGRRPAFAGLALASALYLAGAVFVIASTTLGPSGLESPFQAFVALLLGVHVAHASLGGVFAVWILRHEAGPTESALSLARLVIHFLTALLFAIVWLLFGRP